MAGAGTAVGAKGAIGLAAVAVGAVVVAKAVSPSANAPVIEAGSTPGTDKISAPTFLNRATFGATDSSIAMLQQVGIQQWLNSQVNAAPTAGGAAGYWTKTPHFHLDWVTRRSADFAASYQAALKAAVDPAARAKIRLRRADKTQFAESFWARATLGDDQLRHRLALALSEIFVVSFASSTITPRIAASWYDMLSARAFGSYLDLLKAVTLHPAMGIYLNIIGNAQADKDPSRHPDENYAREVMQLMSIGQNLLNQDGSNKLDSNRAPVPTYTHDDIADLAKVFTGWGWFAKTPTANTFAKQPADGVDGAAADVQDLISYPAYHSQLSKNFLGATINAYTGAQPTTMAGALSLRDYQTKSLDTALKVIAGHPNVAPFIARHLIQRFVTSNPSASYIERVGKTFKGDPDRPETYGNLLATLNAVLTDPEASSAKSAKGNTFGKLREPVLRMTHWLRACEATSKPSATSATGDFTQFTDFGDPTQLSQAPLEALSVFNFWAPDYVPPGTNIAKAGLVAPEFQVVDVLTVASYANVMISVVQNKGWSGGDVTVTYTKELSALSPPGVSQLDNDQALISRLNYLFLGGTMSTVLSDRLTRVLGSTKSSAKTPTSAQKLSVQLDKVRNALIVLLTSPEYVVQR